MVLLGVVATIVVVSRGETVTLSPGVHAEVPRGWAVGDSSGYGMKDLVPQAYETHENPVRVSDESARISETEDGCKPHNYVDTTSHPVPTEGFNEDVYAYGTLDRGEATVASGHATWRLGYLATAGPSFPPSSPSEFFVASDYPTYSTFVELVVCVEDPKLATSFVVGGELAPIRPKDPDDLPTAERNASVPKAREEVHESIRQRYEANVGAMLEFLEGVDAGGWDGGTDLSEIPLTLDGVDEKLSNPFGGPLEGVPDVAEEPDAYDTAGSASASPEASPEPTLSSASPEASPEPTSSSASPGPTSSMTPESTASDAYGLEPEGEDQARGAVEQYYYAVDYENWAYTYYNLDSASRALFTQEEWIERNQWYADNEGLVLDTMDIEVTMDGDEAAEVTVHRAFTDGTSITRETYFVWEGWWRHHLTEEEKEIFMPDATYEEFVAAQQVVSPSASSSPNASAPAGEEEAVEDAVRGHYEAIGEGDFEEAYSYFGPTTRSRQDETGWVRTEESFGIQSSTIHSLTVEEVVGSTATATVDVSFVDNTGNPRFVIVWGLLREGGEWKLDEQISARRIE